MKGLFSSLFPLTFYGRGPKTFISGVVISLAFSLSIVLATIGLMEGFEHSLKAGLKKSSGDFSLYSREGFFSPSPGLFSTLEKLNTGPKALLIRSEGFLVHGEKTKGVALMGVLGKNYSEVTGFPFIIPRGSIVLGRELLREWKLSVGDYLTLAVGSGQGVFRGMPLLTRFQVLGEFSTGAYEKDLRVVYLNRDELGEMLGVGDRVNLMTFNIKGPLGKYSLQDFQERAESQLEEEYFLQVYWQEYSPLLEAVKVEKVTIGLILQIVVVVAIFNLMAFLIFLQEKRSRELFLIQALGMNRKKLKKLILEGVIWIWVASCLLALVFTEVYDYALKHLPIEIPGEVYHLTQLGLRPSLIEYALVCFVALLLMLCLVLFALKRQGEKSLITHLRREFR